jgi:hypothetical protein
MIRIVFRAFIPVDPDQQTNNLNSNLMWDVRKELYVSLAANSNPYRATGTELATWGKAPSMVLTYLRPPGKR